MPPARSLLNFFRRPLLREIGMQLGLLAVVLQLGLAILHVAPAVARDADTAWCGAPIHAPEVPGAVDTGAACPLCQLPPLGPAPIDSADAAPFAWDAQAILYIRDAAPILAGRFDRPIQPRGPPPFA